MSKNFYQAGQLFFRPLQAGTKRNRNRNFHFSIRFFNTIGSFPAGAAPENGRHRPHPSVHDGTGRRWAVSS